MLKSEGVVSMDLLKEACERGDKEIARIAIDGLIEWNKETSSFGGGRVTNLSKSKENVSGLLWWDGNKVCSSSAEQRSVMFHCLQNLTECAVIIDICNLLFWM